MNHDGNSARAINEGELARQANISTAVLRKWRREGKGPRFIKLGRLVRYLITDVEVWLDAHAVDRTDATYGDKNTSICSRKES